jgi:hypothetical protein
MSNQSLIIETGVPQHDAEHDEVDHKVRGGVDGGVHVEKAQNQRMRGRSEGRAVYRNLVSCNRISKSI